MMGGKVFVALCKKLFVDKLYVIKNTYNFWDFYYFIYSCLLESNQRPLDI